MSSGVNRVRLEEQAAVFDKFVSESAEPCSSCFFWMFDAASATAVDIQSDKMPRRSAGITCDGASHGSAIEEREILRGAWARPYAAARTWCR
jgi:hypothetical protein